MDVCSSSATSLLHKLIVLSESLSPIATNVSSWIMLSQILVFHTPSNTQSRVVELRGMDSHAYARRTSADNVEVYENEIQSVTKLVSTSCGGSPFGFTCICPVGLKLNNPTLNN